MRRSRQLRRLLEGDDFVRVAGCSDGLGGRIAQQHGFDALWAGSLGISAAHGLPDSGLLTMTEFLASASVINKATTLPVLADCDTGFGDINNTVRMVRDYRDAGIAGVCIEDKEYPKRNSFLSSHRLADPAAFAARVAAARGAVPRDELVVVARLESLIAGESVDDALERAHLYSRAGADALVIHSKAPSADEVLAFAKGWQAAGGVLPVIVIPTAYPHVTCDELAAVGIKAAIFANQALRAAITATRVTWAAIAERGCAGAVEDQIATVKEVLDLIGSDEVAERDDWYAKSVLAVDADLLIRLP